MYIGQAIQAKQYFPLNLNLLISICYKLFSGDLGDFTGRHHFHVTERFLATVCASALKEEYLSSFNSSEAITGLEGIFMPCFLYRSAISSASR
jgi:hypothetical protein